MASASATVPSAADILCESCGYTLNGLPAEGNCPECGTPVAVSTTASGRRLPEWETNRRFWATTRQAVLQTSQFYRTLKTRVGPPLHRAAYAFALRHWLIAGVLVALASAMHYTLTDVASLPPVLTSRLMLILLWVALVTGLFVFTAMGVTHLATWLTAWEAGWRGYRLPRDVVLRGMCYHSAQLLPVAGALFLVVGAYRLLWMLGLASYESLVAYLVVLSAVAVLGAVYLFWTYWIGMRKMLFANQ